MEFSLLILMITLPLCFPVDKKRIASSSWSSVNTVVGSGRTTPLAIPKLE